MQIKRFREIRKGSVVAKFDIYFENMGMTIKDCAYMHSSNGTWIGLPSTPFKDSEGNTKYNAHVFIDKDRQEAFRKKCKELLEPFLPSVFD